jgi:uncharacterized cupin superfamily protein
MVDEARLEHLDAGLTPVSDGWFVVSVPDAAWVTNEALGAACIFEGDDAPFPDVGFTLAVLQPGQAGGRYHREANQEDFLVLAGECSVLVEGEERALRQWDFVHCPPGTAHVFVGAGDGPCVLLMVGARPEGKTIVYPRSELALARGAGVEEETDAPAEAYAPFPQWGLGRPRSEDELPWRP